MIFAFVFAAVDAIVVIVADAAPVGASLWCRWRQVEFCVEELPLVADSQIVHYTPTIQDFLIS